MTLMRRKQAVSPRQEPLILLLHHCHSEMLVALLHQHGYDVTRAMTGDHAVTLCLHNALEAVVIDQCARGQAEGWSVAQSLKMVRPGVPVLLMVHGPIPKHTKAPEGVDCMVSDADVQQLLRALKDCVRRRASSEQLG